MHAGSDLVGDTLMDDEDVNFGETRSGKLIDKAWCGRCLIMHNSGQYELELTNLC